MMNTSRRIVPLVAALLTLLPIRQMDAQVDQRALAQRLLSDDAALRTQALKTVRSLGPLNIGPELRTALIAFLDKGNKVARDATGRGDPVERLLDPEFYAKVCQTVAELRDPAAIAVLAGSLGTCGWVVHREVAAFGEQAAPAVLAVVTSSQSSYEAVNEGLIALRFMVENADMRPLSDATVKGIRRAAEQHLIAPGRPSGTGVTLRWAIDLAVALGDPGLRRMVESLAFDPQTVIARGITDPQLIDQTRKWATDRLAGIPPLPRR